MNWLARLAVWRNDPVKYLGYLFTGQWGLL